MSAFDLDRFWREETEGHIRAAQASFSALAGPFGQWLDICEGCVRNGGKIFFFGNGGSAADSQHLATELTIRFTKDRPAIASIALTTDTSALTAGANDLGFDKVFARQIEALGREGDIAVGISTSGNSPNVLLAMEQARKIGMVNVGLSGKDGGKMHEISDILLVVPSNVTARIQEMHITLGHMLCGALEQRLGYV